MKSMLPATLTSVAAGRGRELPAGFGTRSRIPQPSRFPRDPVGSRVSKVGKVHCGFVYVQVLPC